MTYILDSRESNPAFLAMAVEEGWQNARLTLSRYVILPAGVPDLDAGDFTNSEMDGIVEFKAFSDFVGSTTGAGVHHLHEQAAKCYSTGLPFAIVIYGSRWLFKRESGTGDALVLQALLKLTSIASNYKVTVVFCDNEEEAIKIAKTFLAKCRELPRRMPVYNLLKTAKDTTKAVLCGFEGIGEKTATAILKTWTIRAFFTRIFDALDITGSPEGAADTIAKATPGLGKASALRIIKALEGPTKAA